MKFNQSPQKSMTSTGSLYPTSGSSLGAITIPRIDLPTGGTVPLSNKAVVDQFSALPTGLQRYAVESLTQLIQNLRRDGSVAHLIKLGIVDPKQQHLDAAKLKSDFLFELHWKLVQFLRFSTPSRMAEALPTLEKLACKPLKASLQLLIRFYGAVAYSHLPGEEIQAVRLYKAAVNEMTERGSVAPILTLLGTKANMARLARRVNDSALAEKEEEYVRLWILNNPWILSPEALIQLIGDDIGTGANILNHPEVISLFAYLRELASSDGQYKPMIVPVHSNVDQVIVDNQIQTMCFDAEPFIPDVRFRGQ